jgi:potassium-transporting ATPase potassium-binding subunit
MVQQFMSAAVGLAVAIAMIRGFTRSRTDRLGNFWVDVTRGTVRLLLPLAVIGALILVAGGVVENLASYHTYTTLAGGHQTIPGGLVGSQEIIKNLGNNGGGWFNVNSAHPFENPNGFTNIFEIFTLLLIPFATPRTFGKMVGDNKQGYALVAVMVIIWAAAVGGISLFEMLHGGAGPMLAHGAAEGTEVRFGTPGCSLFAGSTTVTSTGAVNCFHDSLTPFSGGITIFDMALGEIAPGGIGAGMYGILVLAMVTVFVAGLMVGRTPEYIGKKIRPQEMKYAALYFLTLPVVILTATGIAIGTHAGQGAIDNPGPHGLSEVLYAFTSMANNNGSAFAGLGSGQLFYQVAGGIVMLLGRFAPEVFALGLAGSLAKQAPVPESAGTLDTRTPLFVGMLVAVAIILVGLTYFPALALGPFAEGLH